jgi:hypothetical protein
MAAQTHKETEDQMNLTPAIQSFELRIRKTREAPDSRAKRAILRKLHREKLILEQIDQRSNP